MRLADLVLARPLGAAALLGLLTGIAFGIAWPIRVPAPERVHADTWAAPVGLRDARLRESEFSAVRDSAMWAGAAGGSGAVKRATWLLAGIIADPVPEALVIPDGSKDAKRVRVGESLPGGGVVKEILSSGVTYSLEGCTYERLLYGPAESVDNKVCNPGVR